MNKTVYLTLILFGSSCGVFAQSSGVINYDVIHNWTKKIANCKHIPKTDSERLTYVWGESDWTVKSTLKFNSNQTLFEYLPNEDEYLKWSSRKEDFYIYRDLENNRMLDIVKILGKEYAIEDSIHCINWKIRNGMKEIAGHICMNAYYYDSLREKGIIAWFALDMTGSIGPDGYCGLPGIILELDMNNGSVIYTATSIIPATDEIPIAKPVIKKKRKIATFAEYQAIEKKAILESNKQQRPYFWTVNY
ncbi:MAG: GLPGLI family protein [Bacteroidales bacterium]|jgi:GLPGLI family protein|nr:GLPGLI family protein [Bacteroidales bacterium]